MEFTKENLSNEFYEFTGILQSILPEYTCPTRASDRCGVFTVPVEGFMSCMSVLEKLHYPNNMEIANTYNGTCYKRISAYNHHIQKFIENNTKTGLLLYQDVSTHYTEYPKAKHLELAEKMFKITPSHFLKVYTINNLLVVYTNKDLPFSTVLKLKILQWSMFKDKTESYQPLVEEFLQALNEEDYEHITNVANRIINMPLIQELKYKTLNEVFSPDFTQKLNDLKGFKNALEQDYLRTQNKLAELVEKICDTQEEYESMQLRAAKKHDNTELFRFLSKHPYIKNIKKKSRTEIELYYEAPLLYFDDFVAERIIKNFTSKKRIAVVKAMLKRKYEVMTRCRIEFNTQSFRINPVRIGTDKFIGHPHLDEYHCVGNHDINIYECRHTLDYLGAIEQITAAVLNVNFADSVVTRWLVNILSDPYYENLHTWRNKETGELVSSRSVLKEYYNEETQTD